jgi:hypothetical protein
MRPHDRSIGQCDGHDLILKMQPMEEGFLAKLVMPGLVPGIHVLAALARFRTESSFCSFRHVAGARASFDHLVGQREQRGRHGEAERIRGLTINDEFELCRQLDG